MTYPFQLLEDFVLEQNSFLKQIFHNSNNLYK